MTLESIPHLLLCSVALDVLDDMLKPLTSLPGRNAWLPNQDLGYCSQMFNLEPKSSLHMLWNIWHQARGVFCIFSPHQKLTVTATKSMASFTTKASLETKIV